MIPKSWRVSRSVREEVGSSMITACASPTSARAMATICCSAAESRFTADVASRPTPRSSSLLRASPRMVSQSRPPQPVRGRLRPTNRFSATLSSTCSPSSAWRGERGGLPTYLERPLIGTVETVHDLHERALAGAVLPDQSVYLTRLQVEGNIFYRDHASEPLGNAFEPEDGRHLGRRDSSGAGLLRLSQVASPSRFSRGAAPIRPRSFS